VASRQLPGGPNEAAGVGRGDIPLGELFVALLDEMQRARDLAVDQLQELAAELVRLNVVVIAAGGGLAPHAAKRATTTVPIVMTNHIDPIGSGLIAGLASPGGNITGLSLLSTELVGKQLQKLKDAVPRAVRLAVLWNPTSQTHPGLLSEAVGMQLQGCLRAASMIMNLTSRR